MPITNGEEFLTQAFDLQNRFAWNETISLIRPSENDREALINLYLARPTWKKLFDQHGDCITDLIWSIYSDPDTFNTAIFLNETGAYCGYCGLQYYTTTPEPELQIELLPEYHRRGIGHASLSMLMNRYTEITNTRHFLSRVSADNVASQKLMRRLGGIPHGVILLPGIKGSMVEIAENDTTPIDEAAYARLAEEFGTTIKKLRSHALLFRFTR